MDLIMMKNTLKVVLLTSMLPFSASADEGLTPWYVGTGVGINNYEPNCDLMTMKTCSKDDPYAWDVHGGYLFNENFGIELGYLDLGRAEWTDYSNKSHDVGARGLSLGLVALFPLANKWSITAEAGAMNYLIYNKKQWHTEYYSDSGVAPYVGAGIGYNFTDNLMLQAKYRRYENLDEKQWNTLSMESNYWGLALNYRFGTAAKPAAKPAPIAPAAPGDADKDGVNDNIDKCPNTPMTHKVDAKGCSVYEFVTQKYDLGSILFDNDSSVIKPGAYSDVEILVSHLEKYPQHTVVIEGHASNVGTPDYNLLLSERRANAVAALVTSKYKINGSRIKSVGYGLTKPQMAGNSAEAHRLNRRIEAIVTGTEKRVVLR
ncbi:OmpA/MotB [Shewanella denitrificans OS217]|uniref:OmpA/MotB n=2 Tax=Shewanella TaxID=22 RepID=Q12KL5_SHEDO|nr:OmpA/MotB [Shewanella denitrificans OS217]